jgi:hypothetical protein
MSRRRGGALFEKLEMPAEAKAFVAKARKKSGLVPLQNEMYSRMAEAMLQPTPPAAVQGSSRLSRTCGEPPPRPIGNDFYPESRCFFLPPLDSVPPRCSGCVHCSVERPALATHKCYTCIKFDPRGFGHFCTACFEARHPWHRQPHTWLPVDQAEDLDDASKGQRVNYPLHP